MSYIKRIFILGFCFIALAGCSSVREAVSPVVNAWYQSTTPSGKYAVRKGDTLYSIAWRYGWDYRALAKHNRLRSPYALHPGQVLKVAHVKPAVAQKKRWHPKKAKPKKVVKKAKPKKKWAWRAPRKKTKAKPTWVWPTQGKVVKYFSVAKGSKGIDIAGRPGTSVRAARSGRIVYAGTGLRGYGKLVIIKHSSLYLSAYAHNRKLLVRVGDYVKVGQKIAEMGNTGSRRTQLHFEIRRAGRPANPLAYIKRPRRHA